MTARTHLAIARVHIQHAIDILAERHRDAQRNGYSTTEDLAAEVMLALGLVTTDLDMAARQLTDDEKGRQLEVWP